MSVTRDFTVATFTVAGDRILLLWHDKLSMWLPPGGHIEPNELPDDAAVRETFEETGLSVRLVSPPGLVAPGPVPLARPEGVQLEHIRPGHEHIDLIYFAVATGSLTLDERLVIASRVGWYPLAELVALGVNDEVRAWCAQAVSTVAARLATAK